VLSGIRTGKSNTEASGVPFRKTSALLPVRESQFVGSGLTIVYPQPTVEPGAPEIAPSAGRRPKLQSGIGIAWAAELQTRKPRPKTDNIDRNFFI